MSSYLIRRDGQYLVAIAEMRKKPWYSIYKYDGARIPQLWKAKKVMQKLMTMEAAPRKWEIMRFEPLTGAICKVWEAE